MLRRCWVMVEAGKRSVEGIGVSRDDEGMRVGVCSLGSLNFDIKLVGFVYMICEGIGLASPEKERHDV